MYDENYWRCMILIIEDEWFWLSIRFIEDVWWMIRMIQIIEDEWFWLSIRFIEDVWWKLLKMNDSDYPQDSLKMYDSDYP